MHEGCRNLGRGADWDKLSPAAGRCDSLSQGRLRARVGLDLEADCQLAFGADPVGYALLPGCYAEAAKEFT